MTNFEAIEWQKTLKERCGTPSDAAEACDMAIETLKKRPSYLRLIKKYQERQKNQTAELHNLQAQNDRLKAELEAKIIMFEKLADMYDKASDEEPDYGDMKYVHGVSDGIAEAIAVLRGE